VLLPLANLSANRVSILLNVKGFVIQDAVRDMAPGSVIVDLAAEMGGNVQTTKKGVVTKVHGVTHVGLTDLPSRMPAHASTLYANNISGLLFSLGKLFCDIVYLHRR
jgi:NAD/NADP transhydrogenase alpha subunit